jgi:hypothetical protein
MYEVWGGGVVVVVVVRDGGGDDVWDIVVLVVFVIFVELFGCSGAKGRLVNEHKKAEAREVCGCAKCESCDVDVLLMFT